MTSEIHPLGTIAPYKYVVVVSRYQGKYLLSRHKNRTTWETQGGHIEPGESPLDASRRELYEESGALDFDIGPVCDYWAGDERNSATGVVFLAQIQTLGPLPESEMAEVRTFEKLPENVTYPAITPEIFRALENMGAVLEFAKKP